MRKLWIAFVLLATYVSIYPFNFQFRPINAETLRAFLESWHNMTSRGDILGNVVLFVPFGILGMLAAKPGTQNLRRLVFVCLLGTVFAFALQVAQLYLPSRDQALQDVFWNLLGTVVGATLGMVAGGYLLSSAARAREVRAVPWALIASWLFYRLIPFVPSIDFQSIKNSLKPLLLDPQLTSIGVFRDAVAWLVIAYLLRYAQRGRSLSRFLPILILASFSLEVLIVRNWVSASNVLGALVAVVAWFAWLRHVRRPSRPIAVLMLLMLMVTGTAPFVLRSEPASFAWLPFKGYLGGSMWLNTQVACEKLFYYGSLVYLLWRTGLNRFLATTAAFLVVLFIELAQIILTRHSPEITDPLLVIVAAFAIIALEGLDHRSPRRRRRGPRPGSTDEATTGA